MVGIQVITNQIAPENNLYIVAKMELRLFPILGFNLFSGANLSFRE